jgi:hypothetical protein
MHIICDGMQRSGSTWSFNVVKELLWRCRPGEEIYADYEEDIGAFVASVPRTAKHTVLKTHLLDAVGKAMARSGQAKVIYTWRSLPDVIASYINMFSSNFEDAFVVVTASLIVYGFHRQSGIGLIVSYEELTQKPVETIRRIADYLELDASVEIMEKVAHHLSIDEVRKRIPKVAAANRSALGGNENGAHAARNLLVPQHIRHGGTGYGTATLTAEQLERLTELHLGYRLPGKP